MIQTENCLNSDSTAVEPCQLERRRETFEVIAGARIIGVGVEFQLFCQQLIRNYHFCTINSHFRTFSLFYKSFLMRMFSIRVNLRINYHNSRD